MNLISHFLLFLKLFEKIFFQIIIQKQKIKKMKFQMFFYTYRSLFTNEKSLQLDEIWNDLISYKNELNEQITNKSSIKYKLNSNLKKFNI